MCSGYCVWGVCYFLSAGEWRRSQPASSEFAHLSCCQVWLLVFISSVLHLNDVFSTPVFTTTVLSRQIFWAGRSGRSAWTNLSDLLPTGPNKWRRYSSPSCSPRSTIVSLNATEPLVLAARCCRRQANEVMHFKIKLFQSTCSFSNL